MNGEMLKKQTHALTWLAAALVLAGCTATRPAPVVHRTTPGSQPQVATAPQPGAPADDAAAPAQGAPGAEAPEAAVPAEPATEVTPIYQGAIQDRGSNTAPDDPNLKVGPQGIKRAYGAPRPAVQATAPKAPQVTPPAHPPQSDAQRPDATAAPARPAAAPAGTAPVPPVPSTTRTFDGVRYSWPVSGKVLQGFDGISNKGVLVAGRAGDAVLAAADGRVIFAGVGPRGYGNLVILKHANEMLSVYAHNRSLAVKEGQQVKRGQKIAEMGQAGGNRSALHFEVRQGGKPVDPAGVLPKR
ncbi:MAG: peptidoglycan DD-metalloendopeptidase family protein [Lautropia sp.]|nr:peptidoglycan DD-metalloendopeptidase family protein [Lautropia sp.]